MSATLKWRSEVLWLKIIDEQKLFYPRTHARSHARVSALFLSAAFKWRLSQLAPFSHNYQTESGWRLATNEMCLSSSSWWIFYIMMGAEVSNKLTKLLILFFLFPSATILVKQGEKGRKGRSKCQKGEPGTPGLRGESVRVALQIPSAAVKQPLANTETILCCCRGGWVLKERKERKGNLESL